MTKQDFADWKRHPITQALFTSIVNRIQEGKDELGATAGLEPLMDSRKVGKIIALEDLLNLEFEEISTDD